MSPIIKVLVFCLFFLLSTLTIKAQYLFDYPQDHAVWDESYGKIERLYYSNYWDWTEQLSRLSINGDTSINQIMYRKVFGQSGFKYHNGYFKPLLHDKINDKQYFGAMRIDSEKDVYFMYNESNQEQFLFNMDFSDNSIQYDSIQTNHGYKKTKNENGLIIIEDIGPTEGLYSAINGFVIGDTYDLLCYKEKENTVYKREHIPSNIDACDLFFHIILKTTQETVIDYNINMNDNKLYINNLDHGHLALINLEGRVIKEAFFERESPLVIDISSLQNGLYIIKLTDKHSTKTKKIFIN